MERAATPASASVSTAMIGVSVNHDFFTDTNENIPLLATSDSCGDDRGLT
jgi:hypothetical protein